MRIKCDYCGSMIEEQNAVCPNCGATLDGVNRFAGGQPRTIEELKQWYIARKLPPEEVTRFFIGKDIREARAFGIYQDAAGDFVVYKNKSNGQRAVRYQGADEAYAVNELYQKLKGEIAARKSQSATRRYYKNTSGTSHKRSTKTQNVMAGAFGVCFLVPVILSISMSLKFGGPSRGYYQYEGDTYYYQSNSWYYYDEVDDSWSYLDDTDVPEDLSSNNGEYRTYSHNGQRFEDSIWYIEETYSDNDYDDDWDSDYDWDSGDSWDSGGTDWDSDW